MKTSIIATNDATDVSIKCISVMTTLGGIGMVMYMTMLMYLVLAE